MHTAALISLVSGSGDVIITSGATKVIRSENNWDINNFICKVMEQISTVLCSDLMLPRLLFHSFKTKIVAKFSHPLQDCLCVWT